MSGAPSQSVLVRCVCGRKYRIAGAAAGARTTCPACGSLIEVTDADLETGFSPDGLIRVRDEPAEARDAIPVSDEPVRPAGRGEPLGLTGRADYSTEDALLATALSGRAPSLSSPTGGGEPLRRRPFLDDLLASFYFAGNRNNALNVLITSLPFSILTLVTVGLPFIFKPIAIPFWFIVVAYIIQFYWQVLRDTARGDDEIPWFDTDWDVWSDVIWPVWWVGGVSLLCSAPAILLTVYTPGASPALYWALLAGGWFFWPVCVMSVAIGHHIAFLRPDWIVRCVIGIGLPYVSAWLLTMLTLAGWYLTSYLSAGASVLRSAPVFVQVVGLAILVTVSSAANLYFGYVLFRNLGVLFRHFRTRLPWKF